MKKDVVMSSYFIILITSTNNHLPASLKRDSPKTSKTTSMLSRTANDHSNCRCNNGN